MNLQALCENSEKAQPAMSDTSNLSRFSDTSVLCRGERFEVYIDRDGIRRRVAEIGEEISLHYAGKNPVLIGVLHGACMFLADLLRVLTIDCEVDFRRLSSYEEGKTSSGQIIEREGVARINLRGRHVIVVEDIVDTGLTMAYLIERIKKQGPASLRIATLLHKPEAARVHVPLDYVGFRAPNRFLIGYGMDYEQTGRHLPEIYIQVEE